MLSQLRLVNFRCYPDLRWTIPPEGAIIVGNNAGGKTSILEAACFLLRLQSPRTSRIAHLIKHEASSFGIRGVIADQTRRLVWNGQKPDLRVNGEPRLDQRDYLTDSYPIVWLGNADLDLVQAGADARRRYLDFLGTQWHPIYREELMRYNRALKSRNHLLKNPSPNQRQLEAYTHTLALHGDKLMQIRADLVRILTPHAIHAFHAIGGNKDNNPVEQFAISYQASCPINLEQTLMSELARDLRYGQTQIGPHRDDLILNIDGMPASQFASEGQQRTIAIALKMAQSSLLREETGRAPIHLIDDVFGELDPSRRLALLQALPNDSQSIITTTHLTWMNGQSSTLPIFDLKQRNLTLRTH
ncbi:MAG: DNA replication and repair protein RecF [Akkermansia sp.]